MSFDELEKILGKFMTKKVRRVWSEKERGPGINAKGEMVVSGLQVGNVWITVQPLLGVEGVSSVAIVLSLSELSETLSPFSRKSHYLKGDPMRLLFERDLTPHPQYCAAYEWMRLPQESGGVGTQAVRSMI